MTHTVLRMGTAVLAASIAVLGGSAIAYAGGPGGTSGGGSGGSNGGGSGGASSAAPVGPVGFFDQWIAHDSQLQLSENGVGTLTIGDGALNTDQWSVTWKKNPSDSVTITLATLNARSGPGMGNVGDQYIATIQPDGTGFQLLYLHPNPTGPVRIYCTPEEMKAPNAPAPCHT